MENSQIVCGIDIGSSKVCVLLAERISENFQKIIGIGTAAHKGVKKGRIFNEEETSRAIKKAVQEATHSSGVAVHSAVVAISGTHLSSFSNSASILLKNKEVSFSDIEAVVHATKTLSLPEDRKVIHAIPQEFKVDHTAKIKNPLGMYGMRLEAVSHIITGSSTRIAEILNCVEKSGIKPLHVMAQSLSTSYAILSPEERDLTTLLIDIGSGTTNIALWDKGSLVYTRVLPIGGMNFTMDLSTILKVPMSEAEKIKNNFGSVIRNGNYKKNNSISEQQQTLTNEVLEARAEEMLEMIKMGLEHFDPSVHLTGGVVLTGGGSLLKGFNQLAGFLLETPVRMAGGAHWEGIPLTLQNPAYSSVLGLIAPEMDYQIETEVKDGLLNKLSYSLKHIFKEIF